MKKSDFTGTGKVFSFTFVQYFKSKSTIFMLVIMLVMSVVCTYLISNQMGGMLSETFNAEKVTVMNSSGFELRTSDITGFSDELVSADIIIVDGEHESESVYEQLDEDPYSAAVLVEPDAYGSYSVTVFYGAGSKINYLTSSLLSDAVTSALTAARCRSLGVSGEQLAAALAPVSVSTISAGDYAGKDDGLPGGETFMVLTYAYSLIVMMLVISSTSFIIRSIAEEKSSKLVELLMVSVKPLALILGKILATMCFMIVSMLVLISGAAVSSVVLKQITGVQISTDMLSSVGINLSFSGVGIVLVLVVFISIILGYLTFSILSGIAGATCSSMEDINSANSLTAILTLFGYMAAIIVSAVGSRGLMTVCSLLPFVSVFAAPVSFASGVISFGTLFISWLIQIALIILLAAFAARVYGVLIIYRGNRVKLGQLIKIAREAKSGKGAEI
jgi:ABC-type Na+ efflux pump permease subunit